MRSRLEALGFRLALALARVIPRRALLALGSAAGTLGYLVDRRHREVALENVRTTLDMRPADPRARRIVLGAWRHFGRITADTLAFHRFGPQSVGRTVEFEGLERVRQAYARGRGVLLFTAHFGHWELAGLMQGHLGLPLALVARPLDNPRLERLLALRTGAAVIPCFALPRPDGRYRIVYEPEVEVHATDDRDADVLRLTAECTAIIERRIRERPELWLWMHRRWKTVPPVEVPSTVPRTEGA